MTIADPRAWYPTPRYVVFSLLALGVLGGTFGILRAHARMEIDGLQRELCAANLRALRARNPFLDTWVPYPADACAAMRVVAGER